MLGEMQLKGRGMFNKVDRTFEISIEMETPTLNETALFEKDFPYSMYLERGNSKRQGMHVENESNSVKKGLEKGKRGRGVWKLGVTEHVVGSTLWSTNNVSEIAEILGSIVEHEGFEEKLTVKSYEDSRAYESVMFRHLSKKERRVFKEVLEEKLLPEQAS